MTSKNVPALRFPEFRNAGAWKVKTLEEIAEYRRGSFPQPYGLPEWYDDENGMPFVQVVDVGDNMKLKPTTKRKISVAACKQSVFAEKGTVIITIQGSIGRVALTHYDAYIDRTLLLFQNFLEPVEKYFFCHILQNLFDTEKQKAPGGIIKTITKEALSSFIVTLPSLPEQQKIADCLSSLDRLIALHEQKHKALKNHKKGLMQRLFPAEGETTPAMRFPEFQNDGEWAVRKLGNIGEPLMCKRIFKSQTTTNSENTVPFYKIGTFGGIADSYISVELYNEYKRKYHFPKKGDILISASGTIGRLLVYNGVPAYFQDSNIVWLHHNQELVKNNFLFYCYSILNWQTSDGGTIRRLYNSDLKNIAICFPKKKSEQQKIADCLSSSDALITAEAQKIAALKDHKAGLMQQLFPRGEAHA